MIEHIKKISGKLKSSRGFTIGISIVCFVLVTAFSLTKQYEVLELNLFNLKFRLKPATPQLDFLSLIDIDDQSLNSMGQFPWPRYYYAKGMETLAEAGIRQVIYDIQFMDNSPHSIDVESYSELHDKVKNKSAVKTGDIGKVLIDNDTVLSESLKLVPATLIPYSFSAVKLADMSTDEKQRREKHAARESFQSKASIPLPAKRAEEFKRMEDPSRVQINYPITKIIRNANHFGFVDADIDIDGVRRNIRLVRVFNGRIYFNLGLTMVMDLCGVPMKDVEINPGKNIVLKNAVHPETFEKSDIVIPIDGEGKMYINWSSTGYLTDFNHIPFTALFEYPKVRDTVLEIFDGMENASGSTERTGLSGELFQLTKTFSAEKNPAEMKKISQRMKKIRSRLFEIESGYMELVKKNPDTYSEKYGIKADIILVAMQIVLQTEKLKGHSGVIGLTATSSHDVGSTPLSPLYMMPGKYPNIVNTILQNDFISRVHPFINYLIMLLLAIGAAVAIPRLSSKNGIIAFLGALAGVNIIVMLAFIYGSLLFEQLGISLAVILPSLAMITIKFVGEESEKRFIKSAFSQYLSPTVINEIIANPDKLALGGEEREISIFFSDIAGFSTISEKLNPTELVGMLNEYLTVMTDIILDNSGTVDKYEGDAIIAFYGAPLPYDDHAVKCCLSTIAMKNAVKLMCDERRAKGENEFFTRMGVNTGRAVVGNMGSRTRMDYTMIGDAVNLAARLEGANKVYGTAAMISEATYLAAKDHVEVRRLDTIRVVGKNEPINVYELLERKGNLTDKMSELLNEYNQGLKLFEQRDWQGARKFFRAALKVDPDDGPGRLYTERCSEFIEKPPSKGWDGVYRMKGK